jgi:hypothetical protein
MCFDTGRGVMVVVALTVGLLLTTGCATEKGRSVVGGAVYGSMIGTSIVPGIGSAIGAGVGMLAGAVEGTQKEKEAKTQEEAYRQKFYPSQGTTEQGVTARQGAFGTAPSPQPSGRFGNLLALQDDQPLEKLLERDVRQSAALAQGAEPESAVAKLYRELAALRTERGALEAKVGRLGALLEEYDRTGRGSQLLLDQMADALGMLHQTGAASSSGYEGTELLYLQQEYEIALAMQNKPLAEAVARRFERLSGRMPQKPPASSQLSAPSGF